MVAIRLSTTVGEDRRLVIDLPEEIPAGKIEVIILPSEGERTPVQNLAYEVARAKLLAAGALLTDIDVPEDARSLTLEERLRIGTLLPGARPSDEIINEDRGQW